MERLTDAWFRAIQKNAEIDHRREGWDRRVSRSDVDILIAEIKRLRQAEPFTIPVEIPELYSEGTCSEKCPLMCDGFCKKGWLARKIVDYGTPQHRVLLLPGPKCPRHYKPSIETDQVC